MGVGAWDSCSHCILDQEIQEWSEYMLCGCLTVLLSPGSPAQEVILPTARICLEQFLTPVNVITMIPHSHVQAILDSVKLTINVITSILQVKHAALCWLFFSILIEGHHLHSL